MEGQCAASAAASPSRMVTTRPPPLRPRCAQAAPVRSTSRDGATNGPRFLAYVTGTLIPTLKRGDTVIMDNLSAHKVSGIREAIEAAGARLLYLPAYSPDFNPIEQLFAKLKALLRTAAPRTVADLWPAIRHAFTPLRIRRMSHLSRGRRLRRL